MECTDNRTFGHAAQKMKEGAAEFKDAAMQSGSEFKDAAVQKTGELSDAAFRKGAEFRDAAMRKAAQLRDATAETYKKCRSGTDALVRENPYRTALIAFSIGALVGVFTAVSAARCSRDA